MYCENCYKDIPVGENYFIYKGEEKNFCCVECITDYMCYSNKISIETNTGNDEAESE